MKPVNPSSENNATFNSPTELLMIRISHFLLILILLPLAVFGQEWTAEEASDAFRHFMDGSDLDYDKILEEGLILDAYYQSRNDTCKMARIAPRIADCYESTGRLDSALSILLRSERWALNCSPENYLRNVMMQNSVYLALAQFDVVISNTEEVIDLLKDEMPDSSFNAIRVNTAIAFVYTGRYDEAKQIFREYYAKGVVTNDSVQQFDALSNLGALAGYLDELDSAEYYLNWALSYCNTMVCNDHLELLQNLATLASYRDDYELSKYYLDSAISHAIRLKNLEFEADLHRELAMTLYNLERYEESADELIEHANLKDTLVGKEVIERVAEYQELFESEKKTRKIRELELDQLNAEYRESKLRQNRNLLMIIGGGILVLAIGLWSRLRYIARTKKIIEKEKDRSDELLLNILPQEVAEELKIKGESEARTFDNVTVIFTDFLDFTATAGNFTAKELVDEIHTCFMAFDQIIQENGIEKIKTIGDAYMAAGGLQKTRSSGPADVVNAGLAMQAFISERHKIRKDEGKPAFEMRVGIHTGPVVAGIVGVKKFQYVGMDDG